MEWQLSGDLSEILRMCTTLAGSGRAKMLTHRCPRKQKHGVNDSQNRKSSGGPAQSHMGSFAPTYFCVTENGRSGLVAPRCSVVYFMEHISICKLRTWKS